MHCTPWEAFRPIAELEFMTFRDAGRGCSDFNLSVQDCLWGMWKAVQNGLCDMSSFSVEEYEFYEKVENGDWNWITPGFIAFASPSDPEFIKSKRDGVKSATALHRRLPTPFQNCLKYFEERGVKLVVRLNNMLYDRATFLERNIDHVELFFEDGTNPTDEIVRSFIDMSDRVIGAGGVVAVHVGGLLRLVLFSQLWIVQSWSWPYWNTYRRLPHLEVWLHSERSHWIYAHRSPWQCCGAPASECNAAKVFYQLADQAIL